MSDQNDRSNETNPSAAAHGRARHQRRELRSFGRRHGRRLRPHQAERVARLLPRLRLDLARTPPEPLTDLFDGMRRQVWLEIGLGGGEHLLWQAEHNPDAGLIGCEPFIDGIAKTLGGIEARNLDNIRLHADDARDVIRWLPDAAIARTFILFPDPWPKKRHRKRRLVTTALLRDLARVMRAGAELRMASDIGDYVDQMLRAARQSNKFAWTAQRPDDWRKRTPDWPPTRYEAKAVREGRTCYFLRFVRTAECTRPE